MSGYAVIDTETTGLEPEFDRVLEVAVILFSMKGKYEGHYSTTLSIGRTLTEDDATKIHRITDDDLDHDLSFGDVALFFRRLFHDRIIVGHNPAFDIRMINGEIRRAGLPVTNDVMFVNTQDHPIRKKTKRRSLSHYAKTLDIKRSLGDGHQAMGDAKVSARLFMDMNYIDPKEVISDKNCKLLDSLPEPHPRSESGVDEMKNYLKSHTLFSYNPNSFDLKIMKYDAKQDSTVKSGLEEFFFKDPYKKVPQEYGKLEWSSLVLTVVLFSLGTMTPWAISVLFSRTANMKFFAVNLLLIPLVFFMPVLPFAGVAAVIVWGIQRKKKERGVEKVSVSNVNSQ